MPKKYVELCGGFFKEVPYKKRWEFCANDLLSAQSEKTKFFHLLNL